MNKSDLVNKVAKDAGLTKADAERAINTFTEQITKSLKKGQRVTLVGFGTFQVGKQAARQGRNPQTGERIRISGRKVPRFKPGKKLKETVK